VAPSGDHHAVALARPAQPRPRRGAVRGDGLHRRTGPGDHARRPGPGARTRL